MRSLGVFVKSVREVRRDLLTVALTLAFAPAFVLLYYLTFPSAAATFRVAVVNQDTGTTWHGRQFDAGAAIPEALAAARDGTGRPVLRVSEVATREKAVERVRQGDADAALVLPTNFSRSVVAVGDDVSGSAKVDYTVIGDVTRAGYPVTATLSDVAIQTYVGEATGRTGPVTASEEAVGGSGARTDFEVYIPGLIVFAVVMLLFLTAMTLAREIESGAMRRLRLTRLSAVEYVTGTSGVIVLIGVAGVLLTMATAWACGFRSEGPVWVALLVLTVTVVSVIGIGMMVAAVARTVPRAFVIANFPLGLLMFFTGVILPMPRITWFTVSGHPVGPFEVLAPTHAVAALGKVFTMGEGLSGVAYELAALTLLSLAYIAAGVLALRRAQRRA